METAQAPIENKPIHKSLLNQKGNAPIIIGVVILFIAVATGAYYFGVQRNQINLQSQQQKIPATKTSTPPATNTSTPTISQTIPSVTSDLTANWKLKSTKLLSFKYPSNWEESQDKATGGYTLIKPISNDKVWIGINDYTYINQSDTPEQLAKQALGSETPVNKKQITVDGHSAVYQERHYPNNVRIEVYIGDVKEMTEFPAQDGGPRLTSGTHSIFMEIRDLIQLETSRTTFNQILTTFKYSR